MFDKNVVYYSICTCYLKLFGSTAVTMNIVHNYLD